MTQYPAEAKTGMAHNMLNPPHLPGLIPPRQTLCSLLPGSLGPQPDKGCRSLNDGEVDHLVLEECLFDS